MSEMRVVGVRVELPANQPILLLRETSGDRYLPIWIGSVEATAIALEQQGVKPARPLTHDLFVNVLQNLGVNLERVEVTEIRDHTFYAELHLSTPTGPKVVSSRPSDAIALAVRFGAPLFASDELLDEVGQVPAPEPEDEQEEIIDEFKDFLKTVNPDDFA